MKTAGIVILVVGLLMTLYTGITYITEEPLVDAGPLHITRNEEHTVNWEPYIGVGLMVIGGAALMFHRKGSIAA